MWLVREATESEEYSNASLTIKQYSLKNLSDERGIPFPFFYCKESLFK